MEGTPFTTTTKRAGPGARIAGLGGTCETCNVAELLPKPVYVELRTLGKLRDKALWLRSSLIVNL